MMLSPFSSPTKMDWTADAMLQTFDAIKDQKDSATMLRALALRIEREARKMEDILLRISGDSGNLQEGTGGTS